MALVTLQTNFIETKLLHGCSPVNLLHICQKAVLMNTYGELFLQIFNQHACHIFHYKLVSKLGFFLIHLTSLMLSSERAVLRLPELSLFLFRLVPCERHFGTFCWILFLQDGAWKLQTAMKFFFRKKFVQQENESPPENVFRIFL